jgi:hypothetical protein
MHSYTARSGARYTIYQGRDDARKHPESRDLWFYVPERLFSKDQTFNQAFYIAEEAERAVEEFDVGSQDLKTTLSEIERERGVKERRRQLRLVKSA